jgi:hypothetical protein
VVERILADDRLAKEFHERLDDVLAARGEQSGPKAESRHARVGSHLHYGPCGVWIGEATVRDGLRPSPSITLHFNGIDLQWDLLVRIAVALEA